MPAPILTGTWAKVGDKTYRHESGVVVRYDWNRFLWRTVGGKNDGASYKTLAVAQHYAVEE